MENSAEISRAHTPQIATSKQEMQEQQPANPTEISASLPLGYSEPSSQPESNERVPTRAAAVPVLTERNVDTNIAKLNSTNKMVSPVLLKLRRNQEKKVIPSNPVDPVQVPPKPFVGFPADRYMSPTDSIMSPVSRGLLARNRRPKGLPPAFVPPKVLDRKFEDAELAKANALWK